jgi:hypothetical protein
MSEHTPAKRTVEPAQSWKAHEIALPCRIPLRPGSQRAVVGMWSDMADADRARLWNIAEAVKRGECASLADGPAPEGTA